jgi:NAD(P)-dependent dehydrogenase (short-subunit alcohol dehydrogenase family)
MKYAVITGTSQGLGLAMANEFASAGWQVIGTARKPRPEGLHVDVDYRSMDSSDAVATDIFWQELAATLKDAEEICLVNNAGGWVMEKDGLAAADPRDFEKQMRSIYFTAVYMTQGLVKHVPQARIINVISGSAMLHRPTELAYGSAKDAERHFFQALQGAYKPEQYRITNLYPSSIASTGPDPSKISPLDLSQFIISLAESQASYYMRDVTLFSAKSQAG